MTTEQKINMLYDKDTKESYQNLLELEELSKTSNELYQYIDNFFEMINHEKYAIRTRGYRMFCEQTKWDIDNKINENIDKLLLEIKDEKPTAVRQKLQSLQNVILCKKELQSKIKQSVLKLDTSEYKDTMRPLIEKDIENILKLIDSE